MQDVAIRTAALTLLHFVWQGVLIGAFAAATLRSRVARTAQGRYVICLVALLACVVTPAVTATLIFENADWQNAQASSSAPGMATTSLTSRVAQPPTTPAPPGYTIVHSISAHSTDFMFAGVLLWLVGAFLTAAYYGVQWFGVDAIRRSALALREPAQLVSTAARLLTRWKATVSVPVMISHAVTTPIVIGIWRPMIIFPAATLARMPPDDFELILLHEMAHIIRRDTLVNALQVALEILLFYHPVVHWLSRRARAERECACDEFVVRASGSAYRYAQALTTLALTSTRIAPLSLGAASGDLLLRLKNLAGDEPEHETFSRSRAQLLLLALLLAFSLWIYAPGATPWWGFADPPAEAARKGPSTAPLAPVLDATPAIPVPRRLPVGASRRATIPAPLGQASPIPNANTDADVDDSRRTRRTRAIQLNRTRTSAAEPLLAQLNFAQPNIEIPAIESPRQPGTALTSDDSARAVAPPAQQQLTAQAISNDPAAPVIDDNSRTTAARLPTPIYNPMPEYPVRARLDGIQGSVVASLRVGPDGRATGLRVIEATPVGVFEGAVRRSLMQWRYNITGPTSPSSNMTVNYRLSFSLDGVSSAATSVCATATASRTCEPR